ncbi:MAG: helix-turn-helix transcriptional regulator [Candidatus Aminicenantes bacterium]|nr:helix-turn-helix transcriptional regulator [Candidatus Aminicenantes bacterium]
MTKRQSTRSRSRATSSGPAYYHISSVARKFNIHPQTLRLYEREGLLRPSRSEGNTRLYTEEDIRQLAVILNLIRDLGVNLAGVEVVLNMRERMRQMEAQVAEFLEFIRTEFFAGKEDEFEIRRRSLVKVSASPLVKSGPDRTGRS